MNSGTDAGRLATVEIGVPTSASARNGTDIVKCTESHG